MSLTVQFETLLSMIAMGCLFGALLDTYQRFIKRSTRSRWITFVCDIYFWCIYGGLLFYCLYKVNYGEVRFYIFLALLCGFSAYQALMKQLYLRLLNLTIRLIVNIFLIIKKIFRLVIIWPIHTLITVIASILLFFGKQLIALAKTLGYLLLFIGKIILWPITILWKLIPKNWRAKLSFLYVKIAGVLRLIKNKIINTAKRWKK